MKSDTKSHWENVYATKSPSEVSWTQEVPVTSLKYIESFGLSKSISIIDVGGGDSKLVDFLLENGYENITVLDISANAIERAQQRLGDLSQKVTWIVSDIRDFQPQIKYAIWHDRAAFHFLTAASDIQLYQNLVKKFVDTYLIIGTFSENGPTKCSGLEIQQYSQKSLENKFVEDFNLLETKLETHTTPFNTIQHFVFGVFKKK